MERREKFEKPETEKIEFDIDDVIVTSSGCSGYCLSICEGYTIPNN